MEFVDAVGSIIHIARPPTPYVSHANTPESCTNAPVPELLRSAVQPCNADSRGKPRTSPSPSISKLSPRNLTTPSTLLELCPNTTMFCDEAEAFQSHFATMLSTENVA